MLTFKCWRCQHTLSLPLLFSGITCPRCLDAGKVSNMEPSECPFDPADVHWLSDGIGYMQGEHIRAAVVRAKPDRVRGQHVGEMFGATPRDAALLARFVAKAATYYHPLREAIATVYQAAREKRVQTLDIDALLTHYGVLLAKSDFKEEIREAKP